MKEKLSTSQVLFKDFVFHLGTAILRNNSSCVQGTTTSITCVISDQSLLALSLIILLQF